MRTTSIVALVLCGLLSASTSACSFAPGYDLFMFGVPDSTAEPPDVPVLKSIEISRGYDDGNFASCSDAGIFDLTFERQEGVGLLFEPEGEFEDVVFPKEVVKLAEGRESFFFVWLDGSSDYQEAIHLSVRVTAFTSAGVASEAATIRIQHPGGRK